MRQISISLVIGVLAACVASSAHAELTSPQVGWQAKMGPGAHNVSGTATIVDDDTVRIDDFTYNGGGISVFFYLGEENTSSAFASGLQIGNQLAGTGFNGTQPPLVIDLPGGETLEGWHAISVWCVDAQANFGSGTFAAVPLKGDYNDNGVIDAAYYTVWRDAFAAGSSSLTNDPTMGTVDGSDFEYWRDHFGESSGGGAGAGSALSASPVPEPTSFALVELAVGMLLICQPSLDRMLA